MWQTKGINDEAGRCHMMMWHAAKEGLVPRNQKRMTKHKYVIETPAKNAQKLRNHR
jgi:hypothetical protein